MNFEFFAKKAFELDADDPLRDFRMNFSLDPEKIYLCSHSLGLPAADAFQGIQNQLTAWSKYGAEGWFESQVRWYDFADEFLHQPLSQILGAEKDEVAVMNSLTINLHLLLTSFYQPTEKRYKILMDGPVFSSDLYAVKSHMRLHGYDSEDALIILQPTEGDQFIKTEDIQKILSIEGDSIAIALFSGVNFLTGQVFDMQEIVRLAHQSRCLVGFDLAHAAGNIPLFLHDWDVDFAVGCSYKYLCSGPGGPGFAFVHEKFHQHDFLRLSGWWGNDPKTRFQMHALPEFIPFGGARSWQVSTPSILAALPFASSMKIFNQAGMENVRKKSEFQANFLLELLTGIPGKPFEINTPKNFQERGCMTSIVIKENPIECLEKLKGRNIICDYRPPHTLRVAPSPLYNSFNEIYQFALALHDIIGDL